MEGINWGNDLANALKTAMEGNKPLFMAFLNPNCKMCNEIVKETFSEESLKEYIKNNMVPLKFTSKKNPEKYLRYKVTDTPTYIIMNTNGDILLKVSGYFTQDDLVKKFDEALNL